MKGKKGQMIGAEYAITIVIVAAVSIGIAVYVRRVVEGRWHDAAISMTRAIREPRQGWVFNGVIHQQYEPYYINQVADREVLRDYLQDTVSPHVVQTEDFQVGASGIFDTIREKISETKSQTRQLSPKDAD